MTALLVCLCGGAGAGLRYLLDSTVKKAWRSPFPLSTLLINLIASLFAGLVAAMAAGLLLDPTTRLLLATGLLGGFSTFSTAMAEVVSLVQGLKLRQAGLYLTSSLLGPLLAGWGGFTLGMALIA
ncbi:fluoride efflux transporter FluC [Bifidobacterium xylocopae]|uniref:Fluoride-specific ion channel FluC n=1 Tax=Bifidobacterium xylocopae TaxID=2493119 RepID=A0A366KE80_9BIFI|nr:CrcB family protein [Bifidobacterium xylocopae]RBQ00005.1 chromosome condensation protein CrcB [Bifidobacterium xylocopae]